MTDTTAAVTPDASPARATFRQSARFHVAVSLGVGVIASVLAALWGPWELAPLIGWDAAALTYVAWTWLRIWPMNARQTARHACLEDPSRAAADLLLLAAAVASLAAIGVAIVRAGNSSGAAKGAQIALVMLSIILSWAVVHSTYTLRYARVYYLGRDGGIDFKQKEPPQYSDFAYVAFTVGMTFQVSDTDIQHATMRATVLRHALISYLFGAVIIAAVINIIAGLSK